jgi:hypothetical protein
VLSGSLSHHTLFSLCLGCVVLYKDHLRASHPSLLVCTLSWARTDMCTYGTVNVGHAKVSLSLQALLALLGPICMMCFDGRGAGMPYAVYGSCGIHDDTVR